MAGAVGAVEDLTLDIRHGEFFALLGPSGCGKTALLRLLAGFEELSAGRILLDGEDIGVVPAHRRPVNMMFQNYALFPHLNVARNIGFGLRQDRVGKREIADRVEEMLALVQLQGYGRYSLLLFCPPGGRSRNTRNQIGTITMAPSSTFGHTQASPCRARSSSRPLDMPAAPMSCSGVMPKCAMIVPTTSEASTILTSVRRRANAMRVSFAGPPTGG
jgi:ABC-type glutathione transport system ATPase component